MIFGVEKQGAKLTFASVVGLNDKEIEDRVTGLVKTGI